MALQKITLNVEGMSCGHCTGMVQRTLEEIDGVSNVSVILIQKRPVLKHRLQASLTRQLKK